MAGRAILFLDVKGSTSVPTQSFMTTWVETLMPAIANVINSASHKNTWGDAVMAVFDSAEEAVISALKILQLFEQHQEFEVRIGLHYGEVEIKYNAIVDREDVFGPNISLAARIEPAVPERKVYVYKDYPSVLNKKPDELEFVFGEAFPLKLLKDYDGSHEIQAREVVWASHKDRLETAPGEAAAAATSSPDHPEIQSIQKLVWTIGRDDEEWLRGRFSGTDSELSTWSISLLAEQWRLIRTYRELAVITQRLRKLAIVCREVRHRIPAAESDADLWKVIDEKLPPEFLFLQMEVHRYLLRKRRSDQHWNSSDSAPIEEISWADRLQEYFDLRLTLVKEQISIDDEENPFRKCGFKSRCLDASYSLLFDWLRRADANNFLLKVEQAGKHSSELDQAADLLISAADFLQCFSDALFHSTRNSYLDCYKKADDHVALVDTLKLMATVPPYLEKFDFSVWGGQERQTASN